LFIHESEILNINIHDYKLFYFKEYQ